MKGRKFLAGVLAAAVAFTGLPSQPLYAAGLAEEAAVGEAMQAERADEETAQLKLSFEDNLADASGKSVEVKENNGKVSYTEGIKGKAALFDGKTSLDLGTGEGLSPANLTLSFWIKPPEGGMGDGEQIITWSKNEWYTDGWYLGTQKERPLQLSVGPAQREGQPYMLQVNGDRDTFFPPNQWTHIAVTYDSGSKSAVVYRNGVKQALSVAFPMGGASTGVVGPAPATQKTIGYNGTVYKGAYLRDVALDEYELYSTVYNQEAVIGLYDEVSPVKFDKKAAAQSDIDALNIPESADRRVTLPTEGASGSVITWVSSHPEIIAADGAVTPPESGTVDVSLTATASFANGEPVTKVFHVSVTAKSEQESNKMADSGIEAVVLADSFLTHASQKESEYLLSLSAKKFLYEFYRVSGLTPPTTDRYQGWERSDAVNFRGHTFGHYMSALSQSYAGTQDAETKARLLAEIRDAVNGLKECQDAYAEKHPASAGYVSAFRESILNQIDGTGSSDENVIVPWYNLHKVLAGLIDIYTFVKDADNGQLAEKALAIAEGFTEYVYNRCSKLADNSVMLRTEYGGMNEALYEIYDITGNSHFKAAAQYFDEISLFNELAAGRDVLSGKHANTTIPKLTGALKRYTVLMDNEGYYDGLTDAEKNDLEKYKNAAINFWDITVAHHTYVTGGNSQSEHFHNADKLYEDAAKGDYDSALTCETCNTYNMLKLTRELYKLTKDKKYMDYYENTYINAILSSQNPETGTTMYFQPMAPGYNKVFNRPFDEFWCCTGTGMENFSKLGDTIYFTEGANVYVNMYFGSTFRYAKQNLKLSQEANMPNEDEVTVKVAAAEGTDVAANTNLRFRIPDWTAGEPELYLNGAKQEIRQEKGYAVVSNVKAGDTIKLKFPMEVKAYSTQDNRNFVAFKYGPMVLSTALGTNNIEASNGNGILVRVGTKDNTCQTAITVQTDTVAEWMANVKENFVRIEDSADGKVQFQLKNTDSPRLVYTPHYMRYKERYGLYMTFEVRDSKEAQANIKREKERLRTSEVTADSLESFDDNNSEAAKNKKASDTSEVGSHNGRTFRHVPSGKEGWFSYDLEVDTSAEKNYLECTYLTSDKGRVFDIYINDEFYKTATITDKAGSDVFYGEIAEIPEKYWKEPTRFKVDTAGNEVTDDEGNRIPVVTVKFQTAKDSKSPVGGLYGIAIKTRDGYRTDAELSKLNFNTGKLTPGFAPSKKAYTLVVPEATGKITLNASPNVPSGLVYVGDILVDDTQAREVALSGKETMLTLMAYAQDHTAAAEYRINIIKSDTPISEDVINKANAVNEVVAGINSLGTPRYTEEYKAKLDAMQEAYDALAEEQKQLVSNYSKLEKAIAFFDKLKPQKVVGFTFDDEENGLKSGNAKAQMGGGTLALVDDAKKGKALNLSNKAYLSVTDLEGKPLLTGFQALTVSYWGKVNNGNANWAFYAAPSAAAPTYQREVYLGILDNGGGVTAERYNNTGSRPTSARAEGLKQNEWRYITVVHSSDSTSIYVNGEFKSKADSSYALEDIFGDNGIFYVGKAPWENGEFYNGMIDELSVYNYALTPEEVKGLYEGKEPEIPDDPKKQEGSLTISCAGFTYDGSKKAEPKVVSTTNTGAAVTYKYYTDAACTKEVAQPSDAGTYYVKGSVAATDTHNAAVSEPVSFTVSKARPQYTLPSGLTAVEGDTLAKVTLPKGFAFEDAQSTSVGAAGANKFKVTYTPEDTKNYETVTGLEVTIQVQPRGGEQEGSLSISCAGFTYDGSKKASPKVVSTTNTGAAVTYKYYKDAACTKEIASPVNAGTYYVKGTAAAVGNYKAAVSKAVKFVISPKKVTKATITGVKTKYYTGKAVTQPTLQVKGYKAGTDYTVSYAGNKKVGKATVTITFKGNFTGAIKTYFQIKKQIPVKGKIYMSGNMKYKVTKSAASGGTVELSTPAKKTYTSITVPSSVKLNGYTFKVTGIASNAFKGNKKLTKVTVGANVAKIGKGAFQSCPKLKKITVKSKKLKSVGANALKGISSKAVITVPKAQKKAYTKLFKGKGQKKTVKVK